MREGGRIEGRSLEDQVHQGRHHFEYRHDAEKNGNLGKPEQIGQRLAEGDFQQHAGQKAEQVAQKGTGAKQRRTAPRRPAGSIMAVVLSIFVSVVLGCGFVAGYNRSRALYASPKSPWGRKMRIPSTME